MPQPRWSKSPTGPRWPCHPSTGYFQNKDAILFGPIEAGAPAGLFRARPDSEDVKVPRDRTVHAALDVDREYLARFRAMHRESIPLRA